MTKKTLTFIVSSLTALAMFLSSCQKEDQFKGFEVIEEISESEEQVVEAEIEPEAEEEAVVYTQGVVTFSSGFVSVNKGEKFEVLDVEDFVELGNIIKTEDDSFCEVQFSDFGIIRIQENTELLVQTVHLQEDQNKVSMKLNKGKILAKVSKLAKEEEFQVRTSTALAGVRGTEFMVKINKEDGSAVFAVKEGKVAIIPVEVADRIEEIKSGLQTETAKKILDEISVPEIIITEDKEVELYKEEMKKVAEEFEEVSKAIEEKIKEIDEKVLAFEEKEELIEENKAEEGATPEQEELFEQNLQELEDLKEDIAALKEDVISDTEEKAEIIEKVFEAPTRVSEEVVQELEEIEKIEEKEFIKEIVIAAKIDKEKPEERREEEEKEEGLVYTKLIIKVTPRDAKIFINDDETGKGRISGLYEPDTAFRIKFERDGYLPEEIRVIVHDQKVQEVSVALKKNPITWQFETEGSPFIRGIAISGKSILAANEEGVVFRVSGTGSRIWSTATNNKPNNNSMPVVFRNRVIFSGIKELTALNLKSGKVIKRIPLGKGDFSSHMFGRRVVPFGDSILYPSNNLVLLLNIDSFEETGRITIPENSNSSPAVYNDRIVIVNRKGVLFTINPVTSDIESTIESDALQPVSGAPTIVKDSAVFAGRGGNVVFTDLMKNEIVWEKKIDVSKGVGIFQDVSLGERAVYPFTGREFYALSITDGKDLFKPVLSTSPPMYHEGKLYFGDYRNRLVVMNASTGRILKSWKLDSKITIQPAVYGNDIMVGTESGIIYRINVKYM